MQSLRALYPGAALSSLAALAALCVMFRAWNQDLTIDEANTVFTYVSSFTPDMWQGNSNNHLLSTLLIRLASSAFGFSPFALRIPAIVGGAVYASAAAILVSDLIEASRSWTRVCLYVLLVFNPFVIDYLVPARGYSPALACEMVLLALIYPLLVRPAAAAGLIPISIVAGLGVAANYSFLFTFSALLFCCFVHLAAFGRAWSWSWSLRVGARLFGPFVAVIALICGDNIFSMPSREIAVGWGGHSFLGMLASFSRLSFGGPNPFLAPPRLRYALEGLNSIAPWVVLAMIAVALAAAALRLRAAPPVARAEDGAGDRFALLSLGAVVLSLALHAALFLGLGVKLPYTRTGLHFIVPLTLVAASPLYAFRSSFGRLRPLLARGFATAAATLAIGFVFAQHFSYFPEWKWNADVCAATDAALGYADALHTRDVRVAWEFDAAGNYYGKYLGYGERRLLFPPESSLFADDGSGRPTIFILPVRVWTTVDTSALTPVYESKLDGTVVALRHAEGAAVPASPFREQMQFQTPCHEHGWFRHRDQYPGPITY